MTYKIEILSFGAVVETYESDSLTDILKWFNREWRKAFDFGMCYIAVYKNDELMGIEELMEVVL